MNENNSNFTKRHQNNICQESHPVKHCYSFLDLPSTKGKRPDLREMSIRYGRQTWFFLNELPRIPKDAGNRVKLNLLNDNMPFFVILSRKIGVKVFRFVLQFAKKIASKGWENHDVMIYFVSYKKIVEWWPIELFLNVKVI